MDKITARNNIANAGVSTRDIAHSIYLATVRGVSGANQNDGMGFLLSAMAELWNIRGVVGNPNAKTKITGRYRGMNVTEQMILNVISQYPNGINGYQQSFDELLGIGDWDGAYRQPVQQQEVTFANNMTQYDDEDLIGLTDDKVYSDLTKDEMSQLHDRQDKILGIGFLIGFVICKFVLHFGWIISLILGLILGGILMYYDDNR